MDLADAIAYAQPRHQGVLVTLKRDGRPQLSNISYAMGDDGTVRISVTDSRAKTANLRRDPRASLYVPGDSFWAYLVLEGPAQVSPVAGAPDDAVVDQLVEVYRAIAGEHQDWADYRRAMVDDGRLVITVRPAHAYGMVGR
jgi:PPOX class probable F420-dependent enzyme